MIYCRFCGKQIPEDAIFCNHCGNRLDGGPSDPPRPRPTIQFGPPDSPRPRPTIQFGPPDSPRPRPTIQFGPFDQPQPRPTIQFGPPDSPRPRPTIQFGPEEQAWSPYTQENASNDDLTISRAQYEQGLPLTTPAPLVSPSQPIYSATPPFIQPSIPPGYSSSTPPPATYLLQQQQPFTAAVQPLAPTVVPLAQLSRTQRLLIQVFQPALAGNAFLGVTLGSIVAIAAGASLTALLLTVLHSFFPAAAQASGASSAAGIPTLEQVEYILGIVPLHVSLRDTLQLLLIMQGVGLHIQYGSAVVPGASASLYGYASPLHGLLVLPALALILGGFLAASTDLQNQIRASLLRGAAVALPYTVLLFILAAQVNGNIPDSTGLVTANNGTISMDTLTLFIFGLLWGALFGVLGASLKVAGGQWRRMIYYFLHNNRRPQVISMTAGAAVATLLGIGLSLLVVECFLAYASLSAPFIQRVTCNPAVWQSMTIWGITQGLFHAVNLFAFSFGAPVTLVNQFGGQQSCFYTNAPQATWSLFDASLPLNAWRYMLLLLPLISLFFGGRVSAALARSQGSGPAALQGAAVALPFTLLMIFFTAISSINASDTSSSTNSSTITTLVQSAGVGMFDLLFWALLSGAVFGMLGGIYQVSIFRWRVSIALARIAKPFVSLCTAFSLLLDRLGGQPGGMRYSNARILLCGALLCALLCAVVAGIAGELLINMSSFYTFSSNQRIRDIISVVILALPGLLLIGAAAAALAADPYSSQASQSLQQPIATGPAIY